MLCLVDYLFFSKLVHFNNQIFTNQKLLFIFEFEHTKIKTTKYQQSEAFFLFILLPSRSRLLRSHFATHFSILFLLSDLERGCFLTASKKIIII